MKNILQRFVCLITLAIGNIVFGQAPIYQFNFDGNCTDALGTITLDESAPVSFIADRNGNSNGAAYCLNRTLSKSLANLPQGNSARSFSFWARTVYSPAATRHFLFGYGPSTGNNAFGYFEQFITSTTSSGRNTTNSAANNIDKPTTTNAAGSWHHYVIIHGYSGNANTGAIFVDGTLQISTVRPTAINTTGTNFIIGLSTEQSILEIAAVIDDFRIYNYALTTAQIANLPSVQPSIPTATSPQSFCSGATVANLTASVTGTLAWFNTATGGTALASSTALVSGNYYVSQTINGVTSARALVVVTVNTVAAPTAQVQSYCTGATVTNLSATGTGSLAWFNVATGGTSLTNATALASGNYYVSQNINGCESARTAVAVTIGSAAAPTASAQSLCSGATVADLTSNATLPKWYTAATGGTQLTSITALITRIYYVSQTLNTCESVRTSVNVTINTVAAPTANFTQNLGVCPTIANLVPTGGNYRWYSNSGSNGVLIPLTQVLTPGFYYVREVNGSCESSSTQVNVANVVSPSAPNYLTAVSHCTGATVNTLNAPASNNNYKWFDDPIAGVELPAATILSTGNYYVSFGNAACGAPRTAVAVTISNAAAPTTQAQSFCTASTVANLVATGTGTLSWFNVASGGTALANATALVSGNYYVSQTINGCTSARTLVAVTVGSASAPTASAQSFCTASTVANLVATGTGTLSWFDVATGGNALASSNALVSRTYYVSQTIGTCTSARTLVAVTVGSASAPTASAQSFCTASTVANLSATGTGTLSWFNVATGGTALASSTALVSGNYYVSQTIGTCTSARTLVAVTINNVASPSGNQTQTFVQGSTLADIVVTGSGIIWYATLSNAIAGSNALPTSTLLVSGSTYFASQTINNCTSPAFLDVTVTVNLSNESFKRNLDIKIYPNPATHFINIEMEKDLQSAEIYSLQGQKVFSGNDKTIDISNLSSGMYMVRVQDIDGGIATQKLVKE